MRTPEPRPDGAGRPSTADVLVADPVASGAAHGWQVGHLAPPTTPDPGGRRAARLEARLAVYAQYAAAVAEEAAAAVSGDEARRAALASERAAAADHFAELRDATQADGPPHAFADALTDALYELRHQDAVDHALGRSLRATRDGAGRDVAPGLPAGLPAGGRLDVRF